MSLDLGHDDPPRPPDRLIDRVTPGVRQQHVEADRLAFDESGRRSVGELQAALRGVGHELADFERILDFGCGCGRVLRWMRPLSAGTELHGCDIDPLAIEWLQQALPFGHFVASRPEPPLPYPDEHFDLIVNHSVFTHLDESFQDRWLPELRRVLRPRGLALLSVHGPRAFARTEDALASSGQDPSGLRTTLERDGIAFMSEDNWIGSSFPDFYHTTFHAPWYIFEHWTRWFDLRAYLPHGDLDHQDVVILEKVPEHGLPRPVGRAAAPVVGERPSSREVSLRALGVELARRVAIRALRPPAGPIVDSPDPAAGSAPAAQELSPNLRSILERMGERVTRLEAEVTELESIVGDREG